MTSSTKTQRQANKLIETASNKKPVELQTELENMPVKYDYKTCL